MNKVIGIIVAVALILTGVYFGVRFATESKARAVFEQLFEGSEDWSIESTYYNPLTQSAVANGFELSLDDSSRITIKTIKVSGFNQDGDEYIGSYSVDDLRIYSDKEDVEFFIKSSSASKLVLDRAALEEFVTAIKEDRMESASKTPFKKVEGAKLSGLSFKVDGWKFLTIESAVGDADYIADGKHLDYPAKSDSIVKNVVFYSQDGKKEYKVEKITTTSTYKDSLFAAKIDADSKELFTLNGTYSIGGLENMPFSDDLENLNNVTIDSFELNYTDRSLVNVILDAITDEGQTREDAIESVAGIAMFVSMGIKNGYKLIDDLTAFLKDPKTLVLKINPAEPISMINIGKIDDLNLTLSFNGSEPFLIQELDDTGNDDYRNYEGDEDYGIELED